MNQGVESRDGAKKQTFSKSHFKSTILTSARTKTLFSDQKWIKSCSGGLTCFYWCTYVSLSRLWSSLYLLWVQVHYSGVSDRLWSDQLQVVSASVCLELYTQWSKYPALPVRLSSSRLLHMKLKLSSRLMKISSQSSIRRPQKREAAGSYQSSDRFQQEREQTTLFYRRRSCIFTCFVWSISPLLDHNHEDI